jgi:hypothetical protein
MAFTTAAGLLTRDDRQWYFMCPYMNRRVSAQRMAANIAKLPQLLVKES